MKSPPTLWIATFSLLVFSAGCPPAPPSQQEQRQALVSRWITIEAGSQNAASSALNAEDARAIIAQVPTLSRVVTERVAELTLETESGTTREVSVCGTGPEYRRLLEDRVRARVTSGRFLEAEDQGRATGVVVLSESLAQALDGEADPVGSQIALAGRKVTVIGVISDGAGQDVSDVTRDAYVPLAHLRDLIAMQGDPSVTTLDRIRCKVESLAQVEDTRSVIENIMKQRSPESEVRIR